MPLYCVLIPFLVAFAATMWVYPGILKIAKLKNIVDNPNARKLQQIPIPILGGTAVFFGLTVGLFCAQLLVDCRVLFPVFCGMTVILFIGMMDDIITLSARLRFVIEIAVVLLLIFTTGYSLNSLHGLWGIGVIPQWAAVILTIVAAVGIINAINMIDGVDGLSSGFGIMASVLFGVLFYVAGDVRMLVLSAVSVGVLIPFFFHNVFGKRSKMFIGDSGTLVMGLIMAVFVVAILRADSPFETLGEKWGLIPFTIAVLSVPVFDTLRVMSTRIFRGRSPFDPDKTHLHHLFVEMGFSHIGTTIAVLIIDLCAVLCWWIAAYLGASIEVQFYVAIIWGVLATFGFYGFMRFQQAHNTRFLHFVRCVAVTSHLERGGFFLWLQNSMDTVMAPEKKKVKSSKSKKK